MLIIGELIKLPMKTILTLSKSIALLIIALNIIQCKSDDPVESTLFRMEITSSNGTKLDLDETTQLTIQGFDQFDKGFTISGAINWSVDNSNVTVDNNGLVTAKTVGTSEVTAQTDGITQTISIRVWDSTAPRTEIYVSDVGSNRNGPHRILLYDEEGQNGEVFISSNVNRPQDIIFLEDQNIAIVSNLGTNNITKYNASTGDYLGVWASGINQPTRMEIGPDRLIYVIQWGGGPVKRYNQDGSFVDDFTSSSINQAIGIAWDSNQNLYVSSFNNGSNGYVKKFDQNGLDLGFFINSSLVGPTDIWFDLSGNMLVNDWSGNSVKKFNSGGQFLSNFITGLSQPEGVAFINNNILIGNSGTGSVKLFDSGGTFVKDIVAPRAAGLTTTNAVTVRHVN